MANPFFHFKQFSIKQDRAAMKVGTDGVLLGAWTMVPKRAGQILDIGAGTGLISLMLAQRTSSKCKIDAIDSNANAYKQACENVAESCWQKRISVMHMSLDKFTENTQNKYDLIVCNPPFFSSGSVSEDKDRAAARHTGELCFEVLIDCTRKLLTPEGVFSVVIPAESKAHFIQSAERANIYTTRITNVSPKPDKQAHRALISFCMTPQSYRENSLVIENATRHDYTDDYKELLRDFYLAF